MRTPAVALFLAAAIATPSQVDAAALEPYQMVRSLQLVQDRIAAGDHAALPMQNKLLEMIDARLREAGKDDFSDQRNFHAMLVYAMSGGNPATIEAVLLRLKPENTDAALANGILDYLRGRQGEARSSLSHIDPLTVAPELGAFLALVKATITTTDNATAASRLFDQARLLGPGTLVEEAALRRSLSLAAKLADAERFLRSASQYVRRYLRSPYASQFADAFIEGVISLRATIDLEKVGNIVAGMDRDQRKFIYLRLARRSAIDGLTELSAFASRGAERVDEEEKARRDPRAELYSSLATMTTATAGNVLAQLRTIDRSRLSENDRRLLEAAEAVAAEITAAPGRPTPDATQDAAIFEDDAGGTEPTVEPAATPVPEPAAVQPPAPQTATAEPANAAPQPESAATEAVAAEIDAPTAAAAAIAGEARKKLEVVDKLLGGLPQ